MYCRGILYSYFFYRQISAKMFLSCHGLPVVSDWFLPVMRDGHDECIIQYFISAGRQEQGNLSDNVIMLHLTIVERNMSVNK